MRKRISVLASICAALLVAGCGDGAGKSNQRALTGATSQPTARPTPKAGPTPTASGEIQPSRGTPRPNRSKERKFTFAPESAPPGGSFNIEGTGCVLVHGGTGPAHYAQIALSIRVDDRFVTYERNYIDILEDGSWEGTVPIPADAPPGRYDLTAACIYESEPEFFYPDARFTVTG